MSSRRVVTGAGIGESAYALGRGPRRAQISPHHVRVFSDSARPCWYAHRMRPYLDLLRHVLATGERRTDRTGVGTLSVFGTQTRYDLRDGFPLVTTKKVLFPAVVRELIWFLHGATNIKT